MSHRLAAAFGVFVSLVYAALFGVITIGLALLLAERFL